ncbi:MAG: universal stress protein, partial [Pricia sp.]|nr:universal stress protein [Pricia sp.]
MGKKILLPTDFSNSSWNAIQYAIKLFENRDCDFYILNTYAKDAHGLESHIVLDPDDAFNRMSDNRSREGLGDILERLSVIDKDINHRFHVISRSALFLDAVNTVVENLQIDMIVMGAKGMTNAHGRKYGKKTLGVIERVRKCPVLVIPKNVTFNRPEEIVLATNFNTDFKVSEIVYLAEIARISNASIQILSMSDNGTLTPQQKKNKMLIRKYLKDVNHSFNVLPNVKMASALSCFVEIRHSNMISYIDKKTSIWEWLGFGKPNLGKLGYYENVPVLA